MLSKHYNAAEIEQKHYQTWEEKGLFEPSVDSSKEPYCIMMPPPNVTGTLHLGHALDNTLPDILIRRARMQGKDAIYQPGTDHASIAVHVVLDRQFAAQGKTRFDFGREKFLEKAWEWKHHSHSIITNQMRRLGVSCAWERERFTLDDGFYAGVQKAFVTLYERGLIYRGQRLVNWDPSMQTAVSDLEVKHKEIPGHLWHFKYPYADGFIYDDKKTGQTDGIVIATTRPETILADGAIAINPDDPRAKDLLGKFVMVPLVNRRIPIIADDYAKPEFGSGMVKITAAHDFNDFEVYKRHPEANIPLVNLMNKDGTMNENCPEGYVGLDRFIARDKVIADFKELGLFIKAEDNPHNVPHAERDDTILEPFMTEQWYVKGKPLAEKCLKAAADGDIKFINNRDEKIYHHWLENIQDWCISRQLWWGHRIPAYFNENGDIHVSLEGAPTGDGHTWKQDEDILDTWFSSALWPFGTQGWPEDTAALQHFYPNTTIMPGRDILFFWVIRMTMMGLELMGKVPFPTIFTHGMILDEHGQKMSKSKGNVIDPLILMDEYGSDAVRFTMASIAAMGGDDMRMSEKKVEQNRNFCTKLWNAARYGEMAEVAYNRDFDSAKVTHPINQWIIGELGETLTKIDESLNNYRFAEAATTMYHFVWGSWCDWYLELTKPLINGNDAALAAETRQTMAWAFEQMLRMLHPFIPFITEELWQDLTAGKGVSDYLITAEWPTAEALTSATTAKAEIDWLINVVSAVRNVRSENKVAPKARIDALVRGASASDLARLKTFANELEALCGINNITEREQAAGNEEAVAVAEGFEIILPLAGIVDFAAEKARVEKEIAKFEAELAKIDGMLGNESFVARAPEAVVAEQQNRRATIEQDLTKLRGTL